MMQKSGNPKRDSNIWVPRLFLKHTHITPWFHRTSHLALNHDLGMIKTNRFLQVYRGMWSKGQKPVVYRESE